MYLRTLSVIAFFTAPLMAGLFVLRESFVTVVLGDGWQLVAILTAWLAPIGFLQSLSSVGGTVLSAVGRTDALFRLGLFGTAVCVLAFVIGVRWGVTGVAAAYLVATVITGAACYKVLLRILGQTVSSLAAAVLPAVVRASIMAIAMHFAQQELISHEMPHPVRLSLLAVGGALVYLALTRMNAQPSDRDVLRLFMRRA
jgi:O-antigen/teichoic acid export membrane protein